MYTCNMIMNCYNLLKLLDWTTRLNHQDQPPAVTPEAESQNDQIPVRKT